MRSDGNDSLRVACIPIVFEPYTAEAYAQSRDWIAEREIFEGGKSGTGTDTYGDAVVRLVSAQGLT